MCKTSNIRLWHGRVPNTAMFSVEPVLQPIYSLSKKSVVSCEILCRVKTESEELVWSEAYIKAVERVDYADYYTCQLLTSILNFYQHHSATHLTNLTFALNICSFQITSPALREMVDLFLTFFPVVIRLQLEIIERNLEKVTDEIIESLHWYNRRGVTVAIDDFTFNNQTADYLIQCNISAIKLDKDITVSDNHKLRYEKLIILLMRLIKDSNTDIIAEGVESETQIRLLKNIGIELMQGYIFSKPLPLNEIDDILKAKIVNI